MQLMAVLPPLGCSHCFFASSLAVVCVVGMVPNQTVGVGDRLSARLQCLAGDECAILAEASQTCHNASTDASVPSVPCPAAASSGYCVCCRN